MADLIALSKQLRRAADHVDRYGIVQRRFCVPDHRSNGTPVSERPMCTAGVVSWFLTGDPLPPSRAEDQVAFEDAIRFISGHLPGQPPIHVETGRPEYIEHVAAWHDEPGRTAAQVAELLRLCAREAVECHFECQQIAEHGDPTDWCEVTRKAHVQAMTALHAMGSLQEPLAVAS